MTLLAAFQTQLYRYSGQDDIAVGSPIANRNREELEGTDRVFRQHAGDANEAGRESELQGAVAPGAGSGAGGLCAPGRAV